MAVYGTDAGLNAYAAARGKTLTQTATVLLQLATDYLETLEYKGTRATDAQELKWPRSGVVVDGVELASDSVPTLVENAAYAQALAIDAGNGAQNVINPAVKREKLDVMEVEYQDGAQSNAIDPVTLSILRPVLKSGFGGSTFVVGRA